MSGYCHTRSFALRYTDFDFRDELKPSTVLALAQEVAASSADELGFGYEALKKKNYGFITVNTYCELFASARPGDIVTVETWPLPPRHVIFERDYRIKNEKGEIIALLASRWCLIDLPRFSMLPPTALGEVHERCPYNAEKMLEVPDWKIPKLPEGRECGAHTVTVSDCDHYFHANNTKYADFFLDCIPMAETKRISSFQISYNKQAKEGEKLCFFRRDEEGGAVFEARTGDALIAQFRVKFGEERE